MTCLKHKTGLLTLAASLTVLAAAPSALAEGLSSGVGEIGLSFGMVNADDFEGARAGVASAEIEGSFSFHLAPRLLLGIDAYSRWDDFQSDTTFDDYDDPESEYRIGLHALWELNADTRLGVFGVYGDTQMRNEEHSNNYDYYMLGLEARHFVSDDLMIFGQIASGDKGREASESGEGFHHGKVGRLGATYFAGERSAFTFDVEYASADPYIDGSDKGEFIGIRLGGETRLGTAMPLAVTYGVGYDHIDSTSEGDRMREVTFGLGLKIMFGADTPREAARAGRSIGTPHLAGRASVWTEFID